MWTAKAIAGLIPGLTGADPQAGAAAATSRRRRRWIFLAGALPAWALACLVGNLLDLELRALWAFFVPLSALAGGLASRGAWIHFACRAGDIAGRDVRKRRTHAAFVALALGAILLLALYVRFVVRVPYAHTESAAYVVSWSRSDLCHCPTGDDVRCIKTLGIENLAAIHACWDHRWVIELALALAYLLTLGSLGALPGLLTAPTEPPPARAGYLDFDIWIDRKGRGRRRRYRAKAWSSAGFEAPVKDFALPSSLDGEEPFRLGFADPSRGGPEAEAVEDIDPLQVGDELFRAVFRDELREAFEGCLNKAKDGPGVRIRLRLNDVPELACLPWEYLYEAKSQSFLATSTRILVVRYLEMNKPLESLAVKPPLRILAVIANPKDYKKLDVEEEWRRLGDALQSPVERGLLQLERLERPTREALQRRLRTGGPCHVLHFIGHGGFNDDQEAVLVLENEHGKASPIRGQDFAPLLQSHPSLRLAVLNSCHGASASYQDMFAGTAQILVQHGLQAVVAMQLEVTDATACLFAEEFYRALADGRPVDACLGEVRMALAAESNPEWGTPVLYLRATDGRLFVFEDGEREA